MPANEAKASDGISGSDANVGSCRRHRSGGIGRVMRADQRPPEWDKPARQASKSHKVAISRRARIAKTSHRSPLRIGTRHSADRTPDPARQNTVNRIALATDDGAVTRDAANQMMKLSLDLAEISENIGVVVFEIIDHMSVSGR